MPPPAHAIGAADNLQAGAVVERGWFAARCRGLEALPSLPLPPLRAERNEAGEWELEFADDAIALNAQLPQLLAAGATLLELSPRRQTLEELFIALTKDTQDAASDRFGV